MEKALPHIKQFIKFSIVGVGNTVLDFVTYFSVTRFFGLHYLYANTLAWMVAVTFSFTLNKFWTFRAQGTHMIGAQYAKFMVVSLFGLALSLLILYLLVALFSIPDLFAKVVTIGVVTFWNFFINKFWTFKPIRYET